MKKKEIKIKDIFAGLIVLLGIIAFCLMFFPFELLK